MGRRPPFGTGRDTLFVAYFASAEIGCFLALGWQVPAAILDLYAEFRIATNGAGVVPNNKLITALTHYGLDSIGVEEKQDMIDLILSGGPWSRDEVRAILNTASRMWMPYTDYYRPCCHELICRGLCIGGDIWRS